MFAQSLKDLDTARRGRPLRRPLGLRRRLARYLRRGAERRQEARLRADPHLARDVGLIPEAPNHGRTR